MLDLIVILILVAFNGFFSLSEVALISARRPRLMQDAKNGSRSARVALALMDDPDTFLGTAQVGITIVSILTGIYSGEALADGFAALLVGWGFNASLAPGLAQTLIVIVATYLQVELGELFPKRVAIEIADSMAKYTAIPMMAMAKVGKPVIWFLTKNTDFLTRVLRLKPQDTKVTEEEVKSVISESAKSGEVKEVEQDIMERTLVLGDLRVEALMTHRNDLATLDVRLSSEEVKDALQRQPHNAFPVVDGSVDEVIGIVTLKDLVFHLHQPDFNLRDIAAAPVYFPDNMTVYKALEKLKFIPTGLALVCDEFGSLQGLISLRDIMEGLVGSIDEPEELPDIIVRSDHASWVVSGQCLFYDFLAYFDAEELYDTEFTTVGGLILDQLEHIPSRGERLTWETFEFQVVEMDGTRIDKIVVRRVEPAEPAQ
ncbi:MAG: HlyC/CorC family transporter [Bacteroidales bacterium]|nr:HlyC/CorC family transporter [Candidatus Equimonas faecalis]